MIFTVVFYVFVVCAVIQITYYLFFSLIFLKTSKTHKKDKEVPISVIVFVKNSVSYLEKNLPFFLEQEYSKFEVLLVNNASSDGTDELLAKIKETNKAIRIIDVENNESFWGNKKYTYTLAIKAAKYEYLLFSEINTKPNSKFWVSEMSNQFSSKKSIILGYKKYSKENSFLNLLIRFDNLLVFLKSFMFAKFISPYSATANNYAFTKKEFYRVKGFINHIKIKEGKDDLFIRDAANKKNTTFSLSNKSFVKLTSKINFKDWLQEKKTKKRLSKHYSIKNRFLINLFSLTKILIYLASAILFFEFPWQLITAILGAYLLTQFISIGIASQKFKEPYIIFFLPFLEIALILIQISIFILNLTSKPNRWK